MKKIVNYIVIFLLTAIATLSAFAIDSGYKNNLLNVELTQTPDNRVSVLLVFEKPYTDAIKVVYKTDNEYNILLPETYHSVTSVNTLNALNIRSASVKLVPYFNQDNSNGYTKIILKTTRPVIFNAHSSYITTKIAQDNLIDKLERDESIKLTPKTITPTPVKKAPAAKKTTAKTTTNKTYKKTSTSAKKTPAKSQVKTTAKKTTASAPKKPQTKPQTKPVNTATKPAVQPAAKAPENKPAETQNIPQNTDIQKPILPVTPIEQPKAEPQIPVASELSTKARIVAILKDIKNNEYMPLATLILGSLLLLGLLLRLFSKTAKHYTNKPIQNNSVTNEETVQTEIPQEIKDMSWQEKYKYMKEKEETLQAEQVQAQNEERLNQIEAIYASENVTETEPEDVSEFNPTEPTQDEETVPITNNEPAYETEYEAHQEQPTTEEISEQSDVDPFGFNAEPVNEGFESVTPHAENTYTELGIENLDDISDIEPEVDLIFESAPDKEELENEKYVINEIKTTNPIEPSLINQAKISKTKGFYLVRYEKESALIGYIKDKVFLIQSFDNTSQSFVQTRLTEKNRGEDIYLVRSDNYKALVQVTKDNMKKIINL